MERDAGRKSQSTCSRHHDMYGTEDRRHFGSRRQILESGHGSLHRLEASKRNVCHCGWMASRSIDGRSWGHASQIAHELKPLPCALKHDVHVGAAVSTLLAGERIWRTHLERWTPVCTPQKRRLVCVDDGDAVIDFHTSRKVHGPLTLYG